MWCDMIIRFRWKLLHLWICNVFCRFVGIKKFETWSCWTRTLWGTQLGRIRIMAKVVRLERRWNFSPCVIDKILYRLARKTGDIPKRGKRPTLFSNRMTSYAGENESNDLRLVVAPLDYTSCTMLHADICFEG